MNLLFNRKPKDNPVSQSEPTEPPKKKPRGKPFASGNDPRRYMSGRPKLGATLAARYRDALAEAQNEADGGDYTKLDAMIDVLIGKAMEGDQRAIEYLQERGFGKVPDRLELSREGEQQQIDLTVLSRDELHFMQYCMTKARHQDEPHLIEMVEWEAGKQVKYRLVLTRETVEPPDLIEATVTEETSSNSK